MSRNRCRFALEHGEGRADNFDASIVRLPLRQVRRQALQVGLQIVHGLPQFDEADQAGLFGIGREGVLEATGLMARSLRLLPFRAHESVPLVERNLVVAHHDDQRRCSFFNGVGVGLRLVPDQAYYGHRD